MDLLIHGIHYCIFSLILATGHKALGSSALFTCLFEDDNCGLIQRLDDNLNWTRHTGVGWDLKTGPHAAYQGSYYLYFNTSGTEDKDVAIVGTEDLGYSGPACVRFAYIMRGAGMGSLEVRNGTDVVWTRSGSQGDNWIEANADVLINSGSGLSLRGQRGPGSLGDIAVDSLAITTGSCFTQVTLPFSCQFEDDTCDMVQGNTGELEWARRSGSTPSAGTGPPGAAQGSWYIYVESTSSQSGTLNGTAIISTPLVNHTGALCVRFKYHMMGANIGVLHAYTSITGRNVIQTIFIQEGQQGPSWQSVEMTVSDFMWQQQITFYTQNAGGYEGDIALDDLWLHPGECHACQLNNGGCQDVCTLTDNGRQCSCPSDLILFNDTHCALTCQRSNGECQHECTPTVNGRQCSCPPDQVLFNDTHCTLPCQRSNGECQHECTPTVNGRQCSCPPDQVLFNDTHCTLRATPDNVSTLIAIGSVAGVAILVVIIIVVVFVIRGRQKKSDTQGTLGKANDVYDLDPDDMTIDMEMLSQRHSAALDENKRKSDVPSERDSKIKEEEEDIQEEIG